jgi:dihydroflavonol-4-reductase
MILVTGATGFLGRNLIPLLRERGLQVRALVRPSSNTDFLQRIGVELAYAQDISDLSTVHLACQGCSHVVHAAGYFRFWGDKSTFRRVNVNGTAAVLSGAKAAGVERLIHISSLVVIGKTIPGRTIDETHPCRPQDAYQQSKLEGERLAMSYYHHYDLPVLVLRPGAYYGPWGRYAFNRLFFEEPLRGWRIRIDGGRRITFPVYVRDVARVIVSALTLGRPGQSYNVSGKSLDHNTVNNTVSDLAGISNWRFDVPTPAIVTLARVWTALAKVTGREPFYPISLKPYVFQNWIASSDKAKAELNFAPTPFAEGALSTLEWYRQQGLASSGTGKVDLLREIFSAGS